MLNLPLVLILSLVSLKAQCGMEKPMVVDLFSSLPIHADPAKIGSAQDYVLLSHLVRTPVTFDKNALIEGDLLESWKISKKHREFELNLKSRLKWSDGSPLTADQLLESIRRQIRHKTSTHFNFLDIKSISKTGENQISILLKKSNYRLLQMMVNPEFGVIKETSKTSLTCQDYKISGGPYTCLEADKEHIQLMRNPHYDPQTNYPKIVKIRSSDIALQLESIKDNKTQILVPGRSLTKDEHASLTSSSKIKVYDPHIGFSYWVSINPNSARMKSKDTRNYIQKILSAINFDIEKLGSSWSKANQLYLPGGFGRPSIDQIESAWNKIRQSKEQKIASVKMLGAKGFAANELIVATLKKHLIKVEFDQYDDLNEYAEKIRKNTYDLIQINNDFSSIDVSDNLLVSFNSNRPLLFIEKSQAKYKELVESLSQNDSQQTYENAQKIGLDLINDGYIFPVAYYRLYFYIREGVKFDQWSTLYPDLKIWKTEFND